MGYPSPLGARRDVGPDEQLAQLQTTLRSLDELIFVLDREGRFVAYHAPEDRLLFLAPGEFIGRSFRQVLPAELADPLGERLALVAATGQVQTHEYSVELGGVETRWSARVSPRRNSDGTLGGYTIVSRDVTARRLAEQQVRDLNVRLLQRVDALTEPVHDTADLQLADLFDIGEIQRIQDSFAEATGVASLITAVDGTPITRPSNFCRLCSKIIRGTEKGRANCRCSDAALGRQHPEGPIIQLCLSGGLWDAGTSICAGDRHIANWLIGQVRDEAVDESSMLAYAREIGADEAEFRGALAEVTRMPRVQFEKVCEALHLIANQLSRLALRNVQQARFITEQQRLEEELRQAQKLEAIGQLAGGVAHDFNNILTAQFMHLALLLELPDLDEEVRESLVAMQTGSRMAADLTRQLLAFSRRQILQIRPLELNELLANLLKLFRRVLGEHIAVEIRPAPGPLCIRGDPGMIEQVVINIAVNARDAMPQGGDLRICCEEVHLRPEDCHEGSEARPGRFARLTFRDSGCGMSPEVRRRIFEPFFTTKGKGAGTGLGLATVYGIVKQHQGWIEVDSREGEGTTFHVLLPLGEAEAGRMEVAAVKPGGAGRGELILVVEDEEPVRRVLCTILQRKGYRVAEAGDGPAALELWGQHRTEIRLLFTDMVMPGGIDGRELAERLLAEEPRLQAILASGYSADLARSGLPEGRYAFLAKPYGQARVLEAVARALAATA